MNTVQPIRDMNTVMDIARYLKQNNERDYVMFTIGIYSGLRVSDILKLRVKDVRGKDYIAMREKKTKKEKRFIINKNLTPEKMQSIIRFAALQNSLKAERGGV